MAEFGKLPVVAVLAVVVVLARNNFTTHMNSGVFSRFAISSKCLSFVHYAGASMQSTGILHSSRSRGKLVVVVVLVVVVLVVVVVVVVVVASVVIF